MVGCSVVCQGLDHSSLETVIKALELEATGSGEVDSEGTVRTSFSPQSCFVDSASLPLWSHCHSDNMHQPLEVGLRVCLIGQDAGRTLSKAGLG